MAKSMNKFVQGSALLCASSFLFACGGVEGELDTASSTEELTKTLPQPICLAPSTNVDARRSLMVTDHNVLQASNADFSLVRVLGQMAKQNGNPSIDALTLFRQLWDTQNPAPGLGLGPNCTDNSGTVNGFGYSCRPSEGVQATTNPKAALLAYEPVALVNRFDLAPTDGGHCGEYRIVYANGNNVARRNFIIFESVLPNPNPRCGLAACRPVQELWASLSRIPDAARRADILETFYFNGGKGFAPVIHFNHFLEGSTGGPYGSGTTGQIRTNQFMQSPWNLKEFQLRRSCRFIRPVADVDAVISPTNNCDLDFNPVSVKDNPNSELFDPSNTSAVAGSFRTDFVNNQVASLAENNIHGFGFDALSNTFNDAESPVDFLNRYDTQFGGASVFRTSIQTRLTQIGSTLTVDNIIDRAESQSCKGCHQNASGANLGGGLVFPTSLGFVHTSEFTEVGPDGNRFRVSNGLTNTFLPQRERIMERFLANARCTTCGPILSPADPAVVQRQAVQPTKVERLSGRSVH